MPESSKTSVGIILWSYVRQEYALPPEGYEPNSREIDLIKPYSVNELLTLIDNQENFYKPSFNHTAIRKWLYTMNLYKMNGKYYCQTEEAENLRNLRHL